MPQDVREVVLELGAHMLQLAEVTQNIEEAKQLLNQNLKNGKAYQKFLELVQNQGGDVSYISDLDNLEEAKFIEPVYSKEVGYINQINAREVGKIACNLGAGRIKKEDKIDSAVGIVLEKKVGELVTKDEVLAYIHANNHEKLEEAKEKLQKAIKIRKEKVKPQKTIIKVMKDNSYS